MALVFSGFRSWSEGESLASVATFSEPFLHQASLFSAGFLLYPLSVHRPPPRPHPMTVPAGDKTQPLAARTEAAASPQEPPHGPIHLDRPLIRVAGRGGDSRPPQLQLPAPPHGRPAQLSTLASRPCPAPGVAELLKSRTPQSAEAPYSGPNRRWAGSGQAAGGHPACP